MLDFLRTLFTEASFDNLFVIAGLAFLGIAVVGNVTGKITPGKGGRIASAIIGPILMAVGLAIHTEHRGSKLPQVKEPTQSKMSEMEWNKDRLGADYSWFPLPSDNPKLCEDACSSDSKCKAWTFVKPNTIRGPSPICYLKSAAPPPQDNAARLCPS